MPRDRRIFYIDDDGDNVQIDSECEFHEALKVYALYIYIYIKCMYTYAVSMLQL